MTDNETDRDRRSDERIGDATREREESVGSAESSADGERSGIADLGIDRRTVLAGLGTAGVFGALGTGQVAAQAEEVEEARSAVIRIQTEGNFVPPGFGESVVVPGQGTGFVIHPDGFAVTAGHVVNGADRITATVADPDDDDEYTVRVIGMSECADVALLELVDAEGFEYLEWRDREATAGDEVFALGFVLGGDAYTVSNGIVSQTDLDFQSSWASVRNVIGHTAKLNPGSSGGPLVNDRAQVLGVNFAGLAGEQAEEMNYTLPADIARRRVDQFAQGEPTEWLGINGQAFALDQFSGIYVWAVHPGSPAANSDVQAGDIITHFGGGRVATDGTMREYCGTLGSQGSGAVLPVTVLRQSEGQALEGEINGQPLQPTSLCPYDTYVGQFDDSGSVYVATPVEWLDVDGSATEYGPGLSVAPNVQRYLNSFDTPGATVIASRTLGTNPGVILNQFSGFGSGCGEQSRDAYDDGFYTGERIIYRNCGETGAANVNVAAFPEDRSYSIFVNVQLIEECDEEAYRNVRDSFQVTGEF